MSLKIRILSICLVGSSFSVAAPLRVLITSDTDSFQQLYSQSLEKAGAVVTVDPTPDEADLKNADVLLLQQSNYQPLPDASQKAIADFASHGGGVVAINAALAAGDVAWGKSVLGGAWDPEKSHRFSSLMMLYVLTDAHPIVKSASQFDLQDDTLFDLDTDPDINVLASAFTPKGRDGEIIGGDPTKGVRASIYDIQPQIWTHEDAQHRSFVILPGSEKTLAHESIRTFILRGLAWTAKRENVDELTADVKPDDLRYPKGGPLKAEDAIKKFEMQPGFTASVVAAEPLVNKPIAVQWDAKGRLWVAETIEYPNGRRPAVAEPWKETGVVEPGKYDRPALDRISILTDTDGDGVMDKKTVFHEGLELITGFCMHEDGVIVVAEPDVVWLRDTDGDDKADQEIPLFGGFVPGDTHFVANHFISAPDGWIYASNGSGCIPTDPKTGKELARLSPGVFRFKPDGSVIEQVASQGGNTFGAEVTSDMEIYHGKATSGDPIQHVVLPEWVLKKAPGSSISSMHSVNPGRAVIRKDLPDRAPLMQIDQVGRYTAACSVAMYEGGAWPDEYKNTMFTSEPILDIVHHEKIVPDGPSFKGELVLTDREWLRSEDFWFCPIDTSFGPDGAAYLLDFYTPVVAHNDTRGPQHSRSGASVRPDREHYFGRIYRIQHDGAPVLTSPDLSQADAAGLIKAFSHPNRDVRFNAIRVLIEKADQFRDDAAPLLVNLLKGGEMEEARIEALWALQRLGKLDPSLLNFIAISSKGHLRKNAMLVAESGAIPLEPEAVSIALADPDQRTQLAALRALGASPMSEENGKVLLNAASTFKDPWSLAAAAAAGSDNPVPLLSALLETEHADDSQKELARLLAAALSAKTLPDQTASLFEKIASATDSELALRVLNELSKNPPPPPADASAALAHLKNLLASGNQSIATAAIPFAIAWDPQGKVLAGEVAAASKKLLGIARDPKQPAEVRVNSLRSLIAARSTDPEILPDLINVLDQKLPQQVILPVIEQLAETGEPSVGPALLEHMQKLGGRARNAIFRALTSRPEWTALILDAIEQQKLDFKSLSPREASLLSNHPDAAIAERAKAIIEKLNGSSDKAKVIADLLPEVSKKGDPAHGKELFNQTCTICHQIEGKGAQFGPALDGIGSHPVNELLTHIVDPSLVVDDEHRTWNIKMKDGTQYSALIASENDKRVQLRLPGGATLDLDPANIESRSKGYNSLMPEGFEALGGPALRDIISYLQSVAPQTE
ncbi:ThuA domain-containing protein [Luteolibacter pohnpeiensis]|uniref:ThuA domain-containing protein n=1 Tax=Luteolibacter pohnpeiensis TaxID=454153 RepID=A0A934S6Z8_9BACT|nr:PVC-type heme-binding CxxCH protein [Luteolibacter pohnpeiensis]MBK1883367.1 ThuA domain-containing protein [Luteolibacter pohnpeiensis]